MRKFDERFLISLNAIAFRGKVSFPDLASLPRSTLIDQVLTPRDLWQSVQSLVVIFFAINQVEKAEGFFFLYWYPNRCIVFFSKGRLSLTRIQQFVEIWWWPYLFNDTSDLHHILCSLILEAQTGLVISLCKAFMRKKSIEGFVVLIVRSNFTIIRDIIWKTALLKSFLKKSSFQKGEKKKSLDSLLYWWL